MSGFAYSDREWQTFVKNAGRPAKPWRPPRLLAEGRPFAPSGFAPGAFVEIRLADACATAQVWSTSPRGVWAVLVEEARAVEVCTRNKHIPSCADLAHVVEGAS